jgi:protocatechuate 3,4-dioxygenase alpha subunit
MSGLTPSQTVGPFLSIGLPWPDGPDVVDPADPGAIRIFGVVYDGAGVPVPDALIETWQADPDGYFDHPDDPRERATALIQGPPDRGLRSASPAGGPAFRGFGRCPTADDGTYHIITRRPGPVPAADGAPQAPHIDVSVFARGLLNRVVTRIYFPEEEAANAADPVLNSVPAERRETLIAVAAEGGYRFDIRLQGAHETVFFAI